MQNTVLPTSRSDPYKLKKHRLQRIKSYLRSELRKYPAIAIPLKFVWRAVKFSAWKCKWKLEAWIGSWLGRNVRNLDVDQIFWISPQKIVFSSLREFSLQDNKGRIIGGNWDCLDKKFSDLDIFVAVRQVCQEGKSWPDTIFYQRILEDLKQKQIRWGCRTKEDFDIRCRYIESLFESIKNEGYKSQRELYLEGKIHDPIVAQDEVAVCIGRYGDLLFSDGAHRLTIAKLLGIPSIPVKVTVRHPGWIKLRDELRFYARDDTVTKDGTLYQPVTHPDLADLPTSHACYDRFKLIKDNMGILQGRLLDIGANLGYFCHRFEEEGFECYAVENHPTTLAFLQRLARAENRQFKIIPVSIFASKEITNIHFNVVLALNIFHHFIKTHDGYDQLVALLRNLQMDELFFEPHLPDEPQMQQAYKNFRPDEFVHFIIQNTNLKRAQLIGTMDDGRPLFRIY